MKLAFIKNINAYNEHAVRLSNFSSAQAILFRETVNGLIANKSTPADITTQPYIETASCRLILSVSDEDLGISTSDNRSFLCELTIAGYQNMVKLLAPFCNKELVSFQMLYDLDNPIELMFSSGGKWE